MTIHTGDCVQVMAGMEPESFDAIVTDPPYDLLTTSRNGSRRINNPDTPAGRSARGFMGKTWDGTGVAFRPETWAEALRVAKPGAHLLAFGGTRTYHRLTCALEDAGWEIRDCLVWAYASGFPKSLDVSKAIDKAAGELRDEGSAFTVAGRTDKNYPNPPVNGYRPPAPATDAAKRWQGWGTALKPAWEPIVLARKPLQGTVASNVQRYGTGALNIDASRIGYNGEEPPDTEHWKQTSGGWKNTSTAGVVPNDNTKGRWPPNLLLSDPELFDVRNDGVVGSGAVSGAEGQMRVATRPRNKGWVNSSPGGGVEAIDTYGDTGGYARFFLVPKASRSDREPVWGEELEYRKGGSMSGPETRPDRPTNHPLRRNTHPTTKPVDLMRHLVRLVTPPGGRILDPFLGSGTTAIAAIMEGFECVGIEQSPEYVAIAEARLNGVQQGIGL